METNNLDLDNKFRNIYSKLQQFQQLNNSDKRFFNYLFCVLWPYPNGVEIKDKDLGKSYGLTKSTVQKKMTVYERAKLIERKTETKKKGNGFSSKRTLFISPVLRMNIESLIDNQRHVYIPNKKAISDTKEEQKEESTSKQIDFDWN